MDYPNYSVENYGKLCTEFEQVEAEAYSLFKGDVCDLTKDQITAACANMSKSTVVHWLGVFTGMYRDTKRFCSSATIKVEELTTQAMDGQKKIIVLQDDNCSLPRMIYWLPRMISSHTSVQQSRRR
jgi:hypothetical protein